jgi:hypothetical protein
MKTTAASSPKSQLFFLMPLQVAWWVWLITAALLLVGLAGYPTGFVAAIGLTFAQALFYGLRERRLQAFSVQLRIAFAALLCVCALPFMHWLYWLPAVGTLAMLIFGYCLLARTLYLFPWNRDEPISWDLLRRTFLSRPKLPIQENAPSSGCAGGVCSIEAQVKMRAAVPVAE